MDMRQLVHAALGALRQIVHRLSAGIGQPQHPGSLVKALAGSVVPGCPQDVHIRVIRHIHQQRIAAGDGQSQEGRFQLREGQVIGGDMASDMVHRDQRHSQPVCHGLGEAQPHQHRADQPWGIGDCHSVDILPGAVCLGQSLLRQGGDDLHVLAGGDLRHHAAVKGVHIRLGGNHIREHSAAVLHHRHGSLVTGGLKCKDLHWVYSLSFIRSRPLWAAAWRRAPGGCAHTGRICPGRIASNRYPGGPP